MKNLWQIVYLDDGQQTQKQFIVNQEWKVADVIYRFRENNDNSDRIVVVGIMMVAKDVEEL